MENPLDYKKMLICWNCGDKRIYNIPQGITTENFGKVTKCPICGCYELRRPLVD